MKRAILIFALAVLALAIMAGWQIAACELANFELHDEMRDLAAQIGARIGLYSPSSDEDLRSTVIRIAKRHGIALEPEEITVQRSGPDDKPDIYLAADYNARVKLPGY